MRLFPNPFTTPATAGFDLNQNLWALLWHREEQELPAGGKTRRQSHFFGLVARVVLFLERFINPVCLCGIYFCLILRRMEYMKSFYLICIWFVFIDTFTAVPNRLFPPQHVAVVVFIYWIPYHQQKDGVFFALIPVLPLRGQQQWQKHPPKHHI